MFEGHENIINWAIFIMIMVPVVTIVLGEIVDRFLSRGSRYAKFFQVLRAAVLPSITALLLAKFIFHLDGTAPLSEAISLIVPTGDEAKTGADIAKTITPSVEGTTPSPHPLWYVYSFIVSIVYLSLAYAALVLITALKGEKNPKAWENRIPGLFKAIMTAMVFVVPVLMLLSAWGIKFTDFAKVAGFAGLAIGLALQDALSSITKGFLLVVDKPFAVGDWIEVDGVKGQVIDISWRSTRLQVAGNDIVVIPNLIISDNSVYNYTAEDPSYRDEITLGFSYDDAPNKVKAMLDKVLRDTKDIMKIPAPRIFTVSYDDFSIGYKMYFFIERYVTEMEQESIRDDIMNRIWYAAERNGITIPYPINVEGPPETFEPDYAAIRKNIFDFLKTNRFFNSLNDVLLKRLADHCTIAPFAKGEIIFKEGEMSTGLGLINFGSVSLGSDRHQEMASSGDLISEIFLLGRRLNIVTAKATIDTEVLQFDQALLTPIIETNPKFAKILNAQIDARLRHIESNTLLTLSKNEAGTV